MDKQRLELHLTYMQFSKKLAITAIVSWIVAYVAAMVVIMLMPIDPVRSDLIRAIVAYNATLTGTIIMGYMGNSSVEKYARYKFDFETAACQQSINTDNTQYLG